ncbi:MAG: cupredoxin domain-containing protein [Vicinamibacterales bacterium]
MKLAAALVLIVAAASSSCGDRHPVSPSPAAPFAAPGLTRQLGPSDYHETPMPMPDPSPAPAAVTINIVGTSGTGAFAPNPLQASIGTTVVWTNNDATVHRIVLDDGTNIGTIAPGQSSAPIAVNAAAVTYRCTLHPSMVGQIQDPAVATPAPMPEPPPDDTPPDPGYYSQP